MVEHSTENAGVAGSIPALGTSTVSGSSSVVEHFLAKEDVAGSNPVSRSTNASELIARLTAYLPATVVAAQGTSAV